MALAVLTDSDEIRAVLADAVAADPVRGTVLGTIATSLGDDAWCAVHDAGLAARSGAAYPVTLAGDWDDVTLAALAGCLAGVAGVRSVAGERAAVEGVAGRLFAGRPTARMEQILFRLDDLVEPAGVDGDAVVADEAHRDLVRRWVAAFQAEVFADVQDPNGFADRAVADRGVVVWRDASHEPVSIAARRRVVAGSARIGPVYTPPEHRRHGYGAAATAAATRSVLDEGAVPVLFTDAANPTSNKIYQELGYRRVEDRVVVRLV